MINDFAIVTVPPDSGAATTVALAAGTSAKNSGAIDLLGALSVMITLKLGAITSTGTGTAKLQWSDDNSTWTDITGSSQAWDDTMSNLSLSWGISQIQNRYVRVVLTRATANSAIAIITALLKKRKRPVTQITTGIQNAAQPVVLARSNI